MPNSKLRIVRDFHTDFDTMVADPVFVSTMDVVNLQDQSRGLVARTTSTATQIIKGDFSTYRRIGAFALNRHNLTIDSTIQIELFDDPAQSGSLEYDSGEFLAVETKTLGELDWGVDVLGANIFTDWGYALTIHFFTEAICQSYRITIKDAANPDGYFEASRMILGPYIEPTKNLDFGYVGGWSGGTTQIRTAGGSLISLEPVGGPFRQLSFSISNLPVSERAVFYDLGRHPGLKDDMLISLFPDKTLSARRDYAMFCKLTSYPGMSEQFLAAYNTQLQMQES